MRNVPIRSYIESLSSTKKYVETFYIFHVYLQMEGLLSWRSKWEEESPEKDGDNDKEEDDDETAVAEIISVDGWPLKHGLALLMSIDPLLDLNTIFSGTSATPGTLFAVKWSEEIEEACAMACKLSCKGCKQINVWTGVGLTLEDEDETGALFVCSVTNGGVSTYPNKIR